MDTMPRNPHRPRLMRVCRLTECVSFVEHEHGVVRAGLGATTHSVLHKQPACGMLLVCSRAHRIARRAVLRTCLVAGVRV